MWYKQKLAKCLLCEVCPLLMLGTFLPLFEWAWASALGDAESTEREAPAMSGVPDLTD